MRYFTFPKLARVLYPGGLWEVDTNSKTLFLTFDDGPEPSSTPFILNTLKEFDAKATFFCIGEHAVAHPELFQRLMDEGHAVGNHGFKHHKGWGMKTKKYVENAIKSKEIFPSNLYRPAYGKMTSAQYLALSKEGFQVVFWSLISYDFDKTFSSADRLEMLKKKAKSGANIVFHDSKKAFPQIKTELPKLLEYWGNQGFSFEAIKTP